MMTLAYPTIPLKEMDAAMLVFELSREVERVILDPEERAIVMSAAMLATHLHRHQTRRVRGDLPFVPYIEHPVRNALRLIRFGKTAYRLIAAALLHDVVEDCAKEIALELAAANLIPFYVRLDTAKGRREVALIWLAEQFDDHISGVVEKVSHKIGSTRADYQPSMEMLTAAAIEAAEAAASGSIFDPFAIDALFVKAVDLLDNAGSLRHQLAAGEDASLILNRAQKYLPAVIVVAAAMRELGEDAIADALDELRGHLEVILG